MAAWRQRVLLGTAGLGLTLVAGAGLAASLGWTWGWLGVALVATGMVWGLVVSEARIRVLSYLQLLERVWALEDRVYVADSKADRERLLIGNVEGAKRPYQIYEVRVGSGLDWNTENGRQNLAATILADAIEERLLDGDENRFLRTQLIAGFAADLAIHLFLRKEQGAIHLRENFTTTRHTVINFVANRL
jgi:hypothetical protein